jgi:hypothetical protein
MPTKSLGEARVIQSRRAFYLRDMEQRVAFDIAQDTQGRALAVNIRLANDAS